MGLGHAAPTGSGVLQVLQAPSLSRSKQGSKIILGLWESLRLQDEKQYALRIIRPRNALVHEPFESCKPNSMRPLASFRGNVTRWNLSLVTASRYSRKRSRK